MRTVLLLALSLLSGCQSFGTPPPDFEFDRTSVKMYVTVVDEFPWNKAQRGAARMVGDTCYVDIKRAFFPQCVAHEALHCFKMDWHDGRDSAEFCE